MTRNDLTYFLNNDFRDYMRAGCDWSEEEISELVNLAHNLSDNGDLKILFNESFFEYFPEMTTILQTDDWWKRK